MKKVTRKHGPETILCGHPPRFPFTITQNVDEELLILHISSLSFQSKNAGTVELDGTLIKDLTSVGLYTDSGAIKVRDLAACEVKLASRYGDITSDGCLEGHVTAETYGEGDFTARNVEGAAITVTTDAGDVAILGECNSMR